MGVWANASPSFRRPRPSFTLNLSSLSRNLSHGQRSLVLGVSQAPFVLATSCHPVCTSPSRMGGESGGQRHTIQETPEAAIMSVATWGGDNDPKLFLQNRDSFSQ